MYDYAGNLTVVNSHCFRHLLAFATPNIQGASYMGNPGKIGKLLTTTRDPGEIQDWLFSITPLGVAFVFYFIFIMSSDIEPKGVFLAGGVAAGIIGLESYWIVRGWRKNHILTIILGLVGIAVTAGLLAYYMSFS
ncbi:MAG: hypothetical protein KJO10_02465 [Gammaproteobacteria bacterium]|nr:hypothetical protein [Gammaproteobacteria bacterium]